MRAAHFASIPSVRPLAEQISAETHLGCQQRHVILEAEKLVWWRDSCASGTLTVTSLLCDSSDRNSWGVWSLLSTYRWMYYLFFLVQKRVCNVVEFKMLKCIYKPNASSSWELEQFLLLKDSSGWSAIRENYSCEMSGIQIASFISKLLEEGHAHERWKEIKKSKSFRKVRPPPAPPLSNYFLAQHQGHFSHLSALLANQVNRRSANMMLSTRKKKNLDNYRPIRLMWVQGRSWSISSWVLSCGTYRTTRESGSASLHVGKPGPAWLLLCLLPW